MGTVILQIIRDPAVRIIRICIIDHIRELAADIRPIRINVTVQNAAADDLCDILLADSGFDVICKRRKHRVRIIQLRVDDRNDLSLAGAPGVIIIGRKAAESGCLVHLRNSDVFHDRDADNIRQCLDLFDQIFRKLTAEAVVECAVTESDLQIRIKCADAFLHSLLHCLVLCRQLHGLICFKIIRAHFNCLRLCHDRIAGDFDDHGDWFIAFLLRNR